MRSGDLSEGLSGDLHRADTGVGGEPGEGITPAHSHAQGRRTVTIRQAMEEAGVARRTVYNWIARGKVSWVRTAGGRVRIFADTLHR